MIYNTRRMTRADAEYEQLLARVNAMGMGAESQIGYQPSPMVVNICRQASRTADHLRRDRHRVQNLRDPLRRAAYYRQLWLRANNFVRRWGNQMLRYLPQMHPRDIDLLLGCLGGVEHAIGVTLPGLGRLRRAVQQRGLPGI